MVELKLFILGLSVSLQLMAAFLAVRQLHDSGRFLPYWTAIAAALVLMVIRRLVPFFSLLHASANESMSQMITGLAISALMVYGVSGLKQLFRDLQKNKTELEHLSTEDPLTGLRNRRYAGEWGEKAFQLAKRYGHNLSAMMIDIDHFKKINDRYGHSTGDSTLAEAARKIQSLTRQVDLQCRWGGEEFVILLPEISLTEAMNAAERIRRSFDIKTDDSTPQFTVSIGVASLSGDDKTLEDLIARSDRAMYRAKQAGRNRVRD